MSFPLVQKKSVNESDGFELDSCVMMITNTITRNRTYFPHEEVEKVVEHWNGIPINLNHERNNIRAVVGHMADVRLNGNKLVGKPIFNSDTKEYNTAMGYIKSRFNAGDYPNVSIGLWADGTTETIGDEEDVKVLRKHEPDHVALVVHGSCDPALGCGIGLEKNEPIPISNNKEEEKIDDKKIERERLKKEILLERIKKEEMKNE